MNLARALAVTTCLVLGGAPAFADEYTSWKKDEVKKTYSCTYTYTPKDTTVTKKYEQTVVIYYGDKDRSGWAYYYNADNKPWARCAVPGNAHYNPKVMYWEKIKDDNSGYEGFKDKDGKYYAAGYCPAPKDGKRPIADLPLPPK